MSYFFTEESYYYFFEQQMRQPPGYRRRGEGFYISDRMEWESHNSYEEIVDAVIERMRMDCLRERLAQVMSSHDGIIIFMNAQHRNDFDSLMKRAERYDLDHTSNYAAAIFLLSADVELWKKVVKGIMDTGIYFDRMRIGSVTLEQYILFHAAKDIYNGAKHMAAADCLLAADAITSAKPFIIFGKPAGDCGIR